jgi:hypothetical protein
MRQRRSATLQRSERVGLRWKAPRAAARHFTFRGVMSWLALRSIGLCPLSLLRTGRSADDHLRPILQRGLRQKRRERRPFWGRKFPERPSTLRDGCARTVTGGFVKYRSFQTEERCGCPEGLHLPCRTRSRRGVFAHWGGRGEGRTASDRCSMPPCNSVPKHPARRPWPCEARPAGTYQPLEARAPCEATRVGSSRSWMRSRSCSRMDSTAGIGQRRSGRTPRGDEPRYGP